MYFVSTSLLFLPFELSQTGLPSHHETRPDLSFSHCSPEVPPPSQEFTLFISIHFCHFSSVSFLSNFPFPVKLMNMAFRFFKASLFPFLSLFNSPPSFSSSLPPPLRARITSLKAIVWAHSDAWCAGNVLSSLPIPSEPPVRSMTSRERRCHNP